MKNLLVLLSLLTFQSYANAECIENDWIPLTSMVANITACEPGDQLMLIKTEHNYPLLTFNPYSIEIWKGSFIKRFQIETTYLHQVINRCDYHRVIYSKEIVETENDSKEFNITNPNLDDNIAISYEILPMTPTQAQAALDQAKDDCDNYLPPISVIK